MEAFHKKCLGRLLMISWKQKKTNDNVKEEMRKRYENLEGLLIIIEKMKSTWFGNLARDRRSIKTPSCKG